MNHRSLIRDTHRPQFSGHGVVRIPAVLTADQAENLFTDFKSHIGPTPETNAYGVLRNNVWTQIPSFEHTLRTDRLAEIAMGLLDCTEIICFQDNVICKVPGTQDQVAWHQDYSYWPLDRPEGITLWVALTDASPGNGCMSFVPGSHELGERCPTNFVAGSNQPLRPDLPALNLDEAPNLPKPFPAQAGDVIAHHPLAWHMSPPNLSHTWRCAWSITFVKNTVRWSPEHAPHPFSLSEQPQEGDPLAGPRFPRFTSRLHYDSEQS